MTHRIPKLDRRLKARFIDWMTFLISSLSMVFALQVVKCCGGADTDPPVFYAQVLPVPIDGSTLFFGAYAMYWWWLFIGVIPGLLLELPLVALRGKMMTHIKVVRFSDGMVPGSWRSTVRWLVLYGPMAIPVIGWFVTLFIAIKARRDPQGRGLHDRIAGTIVLDIRTVVRDDFQ